jgi:CheY-like chemotaxis protein
LTCSPIEHEALGVRGASRGKSFIGVAGIAGAAKRGMHGAYALPDLRGVSVLIVDDLERDRGIMASMLDLAGAGALEVSFAAEAKLAIAQLRPDAVITEMALPDATGMDLVRWIRRYDVAHRRGTVVVAVTQWAAEYPSEVARAAGFDGYFTKPPTTDDLVVGLSALLRTPRKPR